ncbi:MAG: hypothetical protein ACRDJN_20920, partial [Chloroflexota bacterium]
VVDAAVEKATFEVPERLVDLETDALAQERQQALTNQGITVERYLAVLGRSEDDWRAELREQAIRQIKAQVLLDAIAEREALTVAPDEVEEEIERTAQSYGAQADQVRRSLVTPEARRRLSGSLRRRKAIEKLVGYAGGYSQEVEEPAGGAEGEASAGKAEQPQPSEQARQAGQAGQTDTPPPAAAATPSAERPA